MSVLIIALCLACLILLIYAVMARDSARDAWAEVEELRARCKLLERGGQRRTAR